MRILFVDTTSFFVTISFIENDTLKFLFNDIIKDDMSSKIMSIIREGTEKSGISLADIDKIMVCTGPGSFTGIRIGVTIAKTIAWALKKDIIGVSSLELYASMNFDTKYIIPMIDARRGYVYAGIYDSNLDVVLPDSYIEYNKLIKYFDNSTIVSYDSIEGAIKPKVDLLKIVKKHINDKSINCHMVNPNYLKITEAEENLRRMKNDKKDCE